MNHDSYFYSINLKYDIDLLRNEVESYVFSKFKENPNYGGFYKKEKHEIEWDWFKEGAFRYAQILSKDLHNLKYTNYLKSLLEDELDIKLQNNTPIAITEPNKKTPALHKDGSEDQCYQFAINFPLFNYDKGNTEFWELDNESETYQSLLESKEGYVMAISRYSKFVKKIVDLKMNGVKLLNTSKYHSVNNINNNNYRMNLSFRMPLENQLSWNEILKRAKEVTWE